MAELFTLIFNGTPAQFGTLVWTLGNRVRRESHGWSFWIRNPSLGGPPRAETLFVAVSILNSELKDKVAPIGVEARSLPRGRARLTVYGRAEDWQLNEPGWRLLQDEMERDGWLEEAETAPVPLPPIPDWQKDGPDKVIEWFYRYWKGKAKDFYEAHAISKSEFYRRKAEYDEEHKVGTSGTR